MKLYIFKEDRKEEVQLLENQNITFEGINYNDWLFNLDKLEYQRSTNIDVPLTITNRELFGFPVNSLSNKELMYSFYQAIIEIDTIEIKGKLFLLDWGLEKINTTFTYNLFEFDDLSIFSQKFPDILTTTLEAPYPSNLNDLTYPHPLLNDFEFVNYIDVQINPTLVLDNFVYGLSPTVSLHCLIDLFVNQKLTGWQYDELEELKTFGLNLPVKKLETKELNYELYIKDQNLIIDGLITPENTVNRKINADFFEYQKKDNYYIRYLNAHGEVKYAKIEVAVKILKDCTIHPDVATQAGMLIKGRSDGGHDIIFDVNTPFNYGNAVDAFKNDLYTVLKRSQVINDVNNPGLMIVNNDTYDPLNVRVTAKLEISNVFYPRIIVKLEKNMPDISFSDLLLLIRHLTGYSAIFNFMEKKIIWFNSFKTPFIKNEPFMIDEHKVLSINRFKADYNDMDGKKIYEYKSVKEYSDINVWINCRGDYTIMKLIDKEIVYDDNNSNFINVERIENKVIDTGVVVDWRLYIFHYVNLELKNKLPTIGRLYTGPIDPYWGLTMPAFDENTPKDVISKEILTNPLMIEVVVFMYFFEYMNIKFPLVFFQNQIYFIMQSTWSENKATLILNIVNTSN